MPRQVEPLTHKQAKMAALVKPEYQAHTIPLAKALGYTDFNGRNYGGPKFPCGMCRHWLTATMLPKDADGKPQDPLAHRRCPIHTEGPLEITRDAAVKCGAFWMAEGFFRCAKIGNMNVTPRACAWRRHHGIEKECRDCGQGRRMVKWMVWMGYSIPEEDDNAIMLGLVEEVK